MDSGEYHPTKPTVIASSSSSDYDINLFGDAFLYEADSGATNLKTYLNNEYDGGDFDGTSASCNDTTGTSITPNIILSYSCGSTGGYTYGGDGTDGNDYKYINDFWFRWRSRCKSSTLYFESSIKWNMKIKQVKYLCTKISKSDGTAYISKNTRTHRLS